MEKLKHQRDSYLDSLNSLNSAFCPNQLQEKEKELFSKHNFEVKNKSGEISYGYWEFSENNVIIQGETDEIPLLPEDYSKRKRKSFEEEDDFQNQMMADGHEKIAKNIFPEKKKLSEIQEEKQEDLSMSISPRRLQITEEKKSKKKEFEIDFSPQSMKIGKLSGESEIEKSPFEVRYEFLDIPADYEKANNPFQMPLSSLINTEENITNKPILKNKATILQN